MEVGTQRSFFYRSVPGQARFGVGARHSLAETLDDLGADRALFISSVGGIKRYAELHGARQNKVAGLFDGVAPHCPQPVVDAAVKQYEATSADTVICVGGGSTIGLGKILKAEHGARFIALPTTYSGSEMTPIYGRKVDGQKRTRVDHAAIPDRVLYDPELTCDLPAHQTAATAMNSLAHAVEALYPAEPHPLSHTLALEAMRLHRTGLPRCLADGHDLAARSDVLYAGFLGGLLVSMVGVALHHALGHVLGGLFEIEHGDYNSVVLPHVTAFNSPVVPGLPDAICGVFGGTDPGAALSEFGSEIGAPNSLKTLGMPADGIDRAVAAIIEKAPRNPRAITPDTMRRLITACFNGQTASVDAFDDEPAR